ncbi:hypothetical protein BJX61DRAFT_544959 [Aspergillus egyptiacus]|nr:hypothetical protein BJX61DRAFT_544959 [Aspergillus egyptiacus]
MFATLGPMQQLPPPSHHPWAPASPSPLSPRRTSASPPFEQHPSTTSPREHLQAEPPSPTSLFSFSPPSAYFLKTESTTPSRRVESDTVSPNYATRYKTTISNPLQSHSAKRTYTSSSNPSARSARRTAFLNRVKQDRDDGRYEDRAEQLFFMEGVAEQKEWERNMKRGAEKVDIGFGFDPVYEVEEEIKRADDPEVQALDEYLEQERALEMELVQSLETQPTPSRYLMNGALSDGSSSFSDEEYDDIFLDLVEHSPPQDIDMSG